MEASLIAFSTTPEVRPALLDEERVRDQISAAEELHYVGRSGPAMIAAGAALSGVLRRCGGPLAYESASGAALLEAMLAAGVLTERQHELLYRLFNAHQRFTLGFAPDFDVSLDARETSQALALMVHLLEGAAALRAGR
jgi:hypothetical protein